MKKEEVNFDFEAFSKKAAEELRAGKPLVELDGVLTPFLTRIIESAMADSLLLTFQKRVK